MVAIGGARVSMDWIGGTPPSGVSAKTSNRDHERMQKVPCSGSARPLFAHLDFGSVDRAIR
jgi:hypothetical protein